MLTVTILNELSIPTQLPEDCTVIINEESVQILKELDEVGFLHNEYKNVWKDIKSRLHYGRKINKKGRCFYHLPTKTELKKSFQKSYISFYGYSKVISE